MRPKAKHPESKLSVERARRVAFVLSARAANFIATAGMIPESANLIMSKKAANTVKGETIIFVILALLVPLWPISLPLFGWLAYRSYKSGEPEAGSGSLEELQRAKQLLDAGAISPGEFDRIKTQTLARRG